MRRPCERTRALGWRARAADAPKERYYSDEPGKRPSLLRDRLCATCASGGRGVACPNCVTVRLRSGDLVVFSGCSAFHGISAVVPEEPAAAAPVAVEGIIVCLLQQLITQSVPLRREARRAELPPSRRVGDGLVVRQDWRRRNTERPEEVARRRERPDLAPGRRVGAQLAALTL